MSKSKKQRGAPKPAVVSFRASPGIVEALDRYADRLREEAPGGNWSRSSAALNALTIFLGQQEESP